MSVQPFFRRLRGWLVLSRASNLPTVWSNCLAGWFLADGLPVEQAWGRLSLLLLGTSALYTAGMFLNDVFDEEFDARHRPERPVVTGSVSRRAALTAATVLLVGGTALLGLLGWTTLALALALDVLIVLYDCLHKRTAIGLILMAGCRFLLYPLAAAAAVQGVGSIAWLEGSLLASYIFGLSCLARGEHLPGQPPPRWPWLFIALPVVCNACLVAYHQAIYLVIIGVTLLWLVRVYFEDMKSSGTSRIALLLAGIVLVDLSVVTAGAASLPWLGWFVILFALARLFQRFVPAT